MTAQRVVDDLTRLIHAGRIPTMTRLVAEMFRLSVPLTRLVTAYQPGKSAIKISRQESNKKYN